MEIGSLLDAALREVGCYQSNKGLLLKGPRWNCCRSAIKVYLLLREKNARDGTL
jgi:hypothetical protein